MTKSEIQDAANLARLETLRANGHAFEFGTHRTRKGSIAVTLTGWHKNDTRRLMPSLGWCANFTNKAGADAYIRFLTAA